MRDRDSGGLVVSDAMYGGIILPSHFIICKVCAFLERRQRKSAPDTPPYRIIANASGDVRKKDRRSLIECNTGSLFLFTF